VIALTWVTPRFLWTLGVIALLLALAPGVPAFALVATLGAGVLLVATLADAVTGPQRRFVRVARATTQHLALRKTVAVAYDVDNLSERPIRVGIIETPVRTLHFVEDEAIADVPARRSVTVAREVVPVARGADAFGSLYVWYENRFGFLRRRMRVAASLPFRVFPDLSAVQRYGALHVRNRFVEAGLRKMRLYGAGTEFESLREFAPGDAFRSIDWKATARRGKLMVVQHEVERSQNVMLVLDCGRLMTPRIGSQRKLDYAVTAALSLASIAALASDRVGVVAFAGRILAASAPRSTRASISRLTNLLYDLEPRFEEANYSLAFGYLRAHLARRSLVVFLTDVIDPLSQVALLSELGSLARRHLVVCVFMNDAAVATALATQPRTVEDAYRRGVALELADERATAAAMLMRTGAIVIDVPAAKLSVALIDEYLRIKQRAMI
jgi:uncharacterized protein (DUF58 family)